jgi:hypothetical protein
MAEETPLGEVEVTITVTLTKREAMLLGEAIATASPSDGEVVAVFADRREMLECLGAMQGKVQSAILAVVAPPRPPFGTWRGPRGGSLKA